jgi:hypothetical protein
MVNEEGSLEMVVNNNLSFSQKIPMNYYLVLIIALVSMTGYGQSISITGSVMGEDNEVLSNASVILLSAQDSTIVSFALANNEG